MSPARRQIEIVPVGEREVLVELPRLWWLLREFRKLFPRAKPAPEVWVFVVRGKTAMPRLGRWDRRSGKRVAEDLRCREQARRDAEWEQSA